MVKRHHLLTLSLLRSGDLMAAALAWGLGYGMRVASGRWGITEQALPPFSDFVGPMLFSLVVAAVSFGWFGLYTPKRTKSLMMEMMDLARAIVVVWGMTWLVGNFLQHVVLSRIMMCSVLVAWLAMGMCERLAGRMTLRWFRRRGWNRRYAAVLGTGRIAQTLFHTLKRNDWAGIETEYFVHNRLTPSILLGRDVLGPYEQIERILEDRPVDIVFVALPAEEHKLTGELIACLANTNVDVQVVPDMLSFQFLRHEMTQFDNLPIVRLTHTRLDGWNSIVKRLMDIVFASASLVALAIPMLLIAVLVKLSSPGPVFYRQVRASLGGKPFSILKFRSMRVDAEKLTGPVWASDNDPRATRLGRILRDTSLDELPQFFNVLKGDMSLVGPRPERPELIEGFRKQIPRYILRHHAKAGLTGWAQVHGLRGQTSLRKRLQYDMDYICNWTLGLDMRILFLTTVQFLLPWRRRSRGIEDAASDKRRIQQANLTTSSEAAGQIQQS